MFDKGKVDFHFHSCHSDGSESIASIINKAKKNDFLGLCLTDHNSCAGVPEFISACENAGIVGLEGTEIFLTFPDEEWAKQGCGRSLHAVIMGRKLDWTELRGYQFRLMEYWRDSWLSRKLDKLESLGFNVPKMTAQERENQIWDERKGIIFPRVLRDIPNDSKNWPTLLKIVQGENPKATMRAVVENPTPFIFKYVYSTGAPASLPHIIPDWFVAEAADMAFKMGGILFAAHPGGNRVPWTVKHLEYFIQNGGKGIEIWQYWHDSEQVNNFLQFAIGHNLLVSGGSDWHGINAKPPMLGSALEPKLQTPNWVLDHLLECLP